MLNSELHVNAITGSTGAGVKPSATSHFSWRNDNISIYKPFTHQHLRKSTRVCCSCSGVSTARLILSRSGATFRAAFSPRCTSTVKWGSTKSAASTKYYDDHSFTFITDKNPDLKQVVNTNKCLLYLQKYENKLLIVSVIDNLLKGASGQAVHNMNLLFKPRRDGRPAPRSARLF